MKVEKIVKWDDHNKVAWCDNGLGFFIRPGYPVKVGQLINTDIHYIEADVAKIKQSIKDMTSRGGKANKYKKWILDVFEEREEVAIWKLQAAAKEQGYSWQMMQKTRLAELKGQIEVSHSKKKGWVWIDVRGKI